MSPRSLPLLVLTLVAASSSIALAQAPAPPPAEPAPAPPPAAAPAPAPADPAPPPPPPPAAEPAPVGVAPVAAQPVAAAPAEEPAPPQKLAAGKESPGAFFQPGALIQIWFLLDHQNDRAGGDWLSQFRVRRAELSIKGEIVPEIVAYRIMIDPAKLLRFQDEDVPVEGQEPAPTTPGTVAVPQPPADTSVLQDAWVTFLTEYADISIGQMKNLVSYEGYNSSSKLILPERSFVSRTYGDRRDLGLRVEKKFDPIAYYFGVFSGQGANQLDTNDQKDLVLRLEVFPIEELTLGALGYVAVGERDEDGTKDRLEGDVRLEIANILLQAEYIRAWDVVAGTRIDGQGAYGALGYTFFDRLQPIVRIGFMDQNIGAPDADFDSPSAPCGRCMSYEVGANYYLRKHEMKLQTSVSYFDPANSDVDPLTQAILSAQVAF